MKSESEIRTQKNEVLQALEKADKAIIEERELGPFYRHGNFVAASLERTRLVAQLEVISDILGDGSPKKLISPFKPVKSLRERFPV